MPRADPDTFRPDAPRGGGADPSGIARADAPGTSASPALACVILAHDDPEHVQRLVRALDPFPVFLHIDVRTPPEVAERMAADLPARVRLLPRIRTGWARWENVEAELAGYRAALATGASHIAVLTGSDYPLASSDEITALCREHAGRSMALVHPFPHPHWGQNGGYSRLRYRHAVVGKRMLRLPIPRRLPKGITLAGGSQLKMLAREHARGVLDFTDANPGLVRFWRRSWIADETFVPSVLSTPSAVPGWRDELVATNLWWIAWGSTPSKSPPFLGDGEADEVLARHRYRDELLPNFFARKFRTGESDGILAAIDASRADAPLPHPSHAGPSAPRLDAEPGLRSDLRPGDEPGIRSDAEPGLSSDDPSGTDPAARLREGERS